MIASPALTAELDPEWERLLIALPAPARERLLLMGWGVPALFPAFDPERALRRAIGGAQPVSPADLELSPERWHGAYVSTTGPVTWSTAPAGVRGLGRLWLNPTVYESTRPPHQRRHPANFRARLSGLLLCDPAVRSAYRDAHQAPGGYGDRGLFIAELVLTAVQPEASR